MQSSAIPPLFGNIFVYTTLDMNTFCIHSVYVSYMRNLQMAFVIQFLFLVLGNLARELRLCGCNPKITGC